MIITHIYEFSAIFLQIIAKDFFLEIDWFRATFVVNFAEFLSNPRDDLFFL